MPPSPPRYSTAHQTWWTACACAPRLTRREVCFSGSLSARSCRPFTSSVVRCPSDAKPSEGPRHVRRGCGAAVASTLLCSSPDPVSSLSFRPTPHTARCMLFLPLERALKPPSSALAHLQPSRRLGRCADLNSHRCHRRCRRLCAALLLTRLGERLLHMPHAFHGAEQARLVA